MNRPGLPSKTHLVLIPSYNAGPRLIETVSAALAAWQPIWVIIDGSTDDSRARLEFLQLAQPSLRIIILPQNSGKGAAVLAGMRAAHTAGFSHALVMDADGQHPVASIPQFMDLSAGNPNSMILGEPEFAAAAPSNRRYGRCIGNWWTHLETLWGGVRDSLFGFRVYPIAAALRILQGISGARGYDFDTQLAVRLYWCGVSPVNVKVPVKYFSKADGGVSHFNYLRDNTLLVWVHTLLVLGMIIRLPVLLRRRLCA